MIIFRLIKGIVREDIMEVKISPEAEKSIKSKLWAEFQDGIQCPTLDTLSIPLPLNVDKPIDTVEWSPCVQLMSHDNHLMKIFQIWLRFQLS